MNLFLDDERDPPNDGKDWKVARTFDEACWIVTWNPIVSYISFDHDLGDSATGYDFVKWLVAQVIDGEVTFSADFSFYVHSQNPVGRKNIESYLKSFLEQEQKQ